MNSNRPYLLRGLHEWILDNELSPHILVNANAAGVQVPTQYVKDGKIVLNVSPESIRGLNLGNDEIRFSARFGGNPYDISVPVRAVLAIYAKENGKGMIFPVKEQQEDTDLESSKPVKKPYLKVIK